MNTPVASRLAVSLLTSILVLSVTACSEDTGDSKRQRSQPDADAGAPQDTSAGEDAARADVAPDTSSPDTGQDVGQDTTPDTTPDTSTSLTLAADLDITGIQAFQTIETKLVEDGAPVVSDVPLVAARETLFRVAVTPAASWTPREVTAELVLVDDADGHTETITDTMTVSGASSPDVRDSSFEFRVPAGTLTASMSASFRLLGDGGPSVEDTTASPARWPQDGSTAPLAASEETGELHVVLVPFRYNGDGSGRLPDTSPQQLALFEDALRALYPAVELRLEVRQAIDWDGYVDWGDFNRELRTLKQNDGAEHAYYYGLIKPADTFSNYCGGRCTTGQSFTVSSADSTSYRVGSGLGFSGERWAWTLVHELGHMHGRGHAPCGVSWWSEDRSYPYAENSVGVPGWDARTDTLYAHDDVTDFMGYCDDLWVSDYTYLGILDRMRAANALVNPMSLAPKTTWRYINWSQNDAPEWGRQTHERDPSTGEWATAIFTNRAGGEVDRRQVPLLRYAHLGERSVLVPEAPEGATHVEVVAPSTRFSLALP
ncbi:hypothetical protein FIV42_25075 [Persicimonas caeni]|uniref:Uncharacterized protein n=1 Tax=Persicimonas caeni TaxID=2292766 RepID=A0A4Y6Q1L8_PERCE|nr:hypothetical protein [Persicimonas caeni]QDG53895.1 hypothetical protein FIV42_25075 [Persicimonas caeni]QED35116.1 hypothetical protein FRD00_25070 [Persicimonas caeni]